MTVGDTFCHVMATMDLAKCRGTFTTEDTVMGSVGVVCVYRFLVFVYDNFRDPNRNPFNNKRFDNRWDTVVVHLLPMNFCILRQAKCRM